MLVVDFLNELEGDKSLHKFSMKVTSVCKFKETIYRKKEVVMKMNKGGVKLSCLKEVIYQASVEFCVISMSNLVMYSVLKER